MIITRTPLRMSFLGGGTDLPEYYLNSTTPGRVFSATIDKYVYVFLNQKFDGRVRVSYSETENVGRAFQLKHDIVRYVMEHFGQVDGWEIVTVADIPGVGSGLGSSSALAVGLLKAFSVALGLYMDRHKLAETAYYIERKLCGQFCGKQDQYAVAVGGMNLIEFYQDETVSIHPLTNTKVINSIHERLQMFYLGARTTNDILWRQSENTKKKMKALDAMASMTLECFNEIEIYPCELGQYLDINWEYKRQLAKGIDNDYIRAVYQAAMSAGANGGKVLGQGGGGFALFHSNPEFHQTVKTTLGMKETEFKFVDRGTEVIYDR